MQSQQKKYMRFVNPNGEVIIVMSSPIQRRYIRYINREFGISLEHNEPLVRHLRLSNLVPDMKGRMLRSDMNAEITAGYHGHHNRWRTNCTKIQLMEVLRYNKDLAELMLL